jgi:hypothetical protein
MEYEDAFDFSSYQRIFATFGSEGFVIHDKSSLTSNFHSYQRACIISKLLNAF